MHNNPMLERLPAHLRPAVDVTAGGVLRGLARSLKARDIAIVLAGVRDDVREKLTAGGAEQDLAPIPAHRTIEDCLRHGAASCIPVQSVRQTMDGMQAT